MAKNGRSRQQAIAFVRRDRPQLFQNYLKATNPSRPVMSFTAGERAEVVQAWTALVAAEQRADEPKLLASFRARQKHPAIYSAFRRATDRPRRRLSR